jgi:CDP-glycerol glycerophosphotransferase (TagB/SpsB family)
LNFNFGIILDRELSPEEIDEVAAFSVKGADIHVISSSSQKLPFEHSSFKLEPSKKAKIDEDIFSRLLDFPKHKEHGKLLVSDLCHENFVLWYYHRFRISYYLRDTYSTAAILNHFIKDHDKVLYFGKSEDVKILLAAENKVEFRIQFTITKKNKLELIKFMKYAIWRSFKTVKQPKGIEHLVLNSAANEHLCLDANGNQSNIDNVYMGYFMDQLPSNFIIIDEIPIPGSTPKKVSKRFGRYPFPKRKVIYNEGILIHFNLSRANRKRVNAINQDLTRKLSSIKSSDPFVQLIIKQLLSLKKSTGLYLSRYLAYDHFFKSNIFKSVTCIGESNSLNRSVLDAAKRNQIKTIGVQHGTIHSKNLHYSYSKADINYNPTPDHYFVWGDFWKEQLMNLAQVNENKIEVTGQIRTDVISKLKSKQNKNFNLVYASQPFRDIEKRIEMFRDVLKGTKEIDNLNLVLRPHPSEEDDQFFHRIAQEENTEITIERRIDLYQQLNDCDGLITGFSTVGAEVIYFNKPLITIDREGEDLQDYAKEGVAFMARNHNDINNFVVQLASGDLQHSTEKYATFIDRYAYKIDGKVSKRTTTIIQNLDVNS